MSLILVYYILVYTQLWNYIKVRNTVQHRFTDKIDEIFHLWNISCSYNIWDIVFNIKS